MACIHIKNYSKFKDYIHPNTKHTINHYKNSYYYILPTYHCCGLKNRNGIRKRVDHKRGFQVYYQCKFFFGEEQKANSNNFIFTIQDIKPITSLDH